MVRLVYVIMHPLASAGGYWGLCALVKFLEHPAISQAGVDKKLTKHPRVTEELFQGHGFASWISYLLDGKLIFGNMGDNHFGF